MKNKIRGGIETIIAIIILTGIVVALIISAVLTNANATKNLSETGNKKLNSLTSVVIGD